jgi:hypothetical protein
MHPHELPENGSWIVSKAKLHPIRMWSHSSIFFALALTSAILSSYCRQTEGRHDQETWPVWVLLRSEVDLRRFTPMQY